MIPTPEQVAQWAREAGFALWCVDVHCPECGTDIHDLHRLVTRAMAEQAEADAKLCDVTPPYPFRPSLEAAHAIRANAPKVGGAG